MKTYKEFTNQLYNITEDRYDQILNELLKRIKSERDPKLKEYFEKMHELSVRKKYAVKEIDRIEASKEMDKVMELMYKHEKEKNTENSKEKMLTKIRPIIKDMKPISKDKFQVMKK